MEVLYGFDSRKKIAKIKVPRDRSLALRDRALILEDRPILRNKQAPRNG